MSAIAPDAIQLDAAQRRRRARLGLAIYFTVLVIGSGALEWALLRAGDSIHNQIRAVVGGNGRASLPGLGAP